MAEMIPEVRSQRFDPAVPLDDLTPHPANANEGDIGLLCELLDANGFAGAVLAQEHTGIIIDGEHRWKAARLRGLTEIPVLYADVDDDTRDRMLAEWNASNRAGRNDPAKLLALLQPFAASPKGLTGTAHTLSDVDDLIKLLNPPPPDNFPAIGDDLPTEHECPSCGYRWSGKSAPARS